MTSAQAQPALEAVNLTDEERDIMRGEQWDAFDDNVKLDLLRDAGVGYMPPFLPAEFQPWSEYEGFEKLQIMQAAILIRDLADKIQAFK